MSRRGLGLAGRLVPIGLAALAVAFLHSRVPMASVEERGEPFVPQPSVARATAFGFEALLADYYWLRAVQIVGASVRPEAEGPLLGRLIDVVTTLNPWVDHPYRFAAVWMIGSKEDVREANRLLERGIEHHPDEWRNRFYLGFNLFYYLGRNLEAADAIEGAAELPGSPRYLRPLVARLRVDRHGLEAAALFLREAIRETQDPFTRAEYLKSLDEIETERRARILDRARERYRKRHGRDIERVEDLVRGPRPVLRELPPELHDWEWVIDEETDRIVSSYYGDRYELHGDAVGAVAPAAAADRVEELPEEDLRGDEEDSGA